MFHATNVDELRNENAIFSKKIELNGFLYYKIREMHNVQKDFRYDYTCLHFRCERERHNLFLYHRHGVVYYVETGYSIKA